MSRWVVVHESLWGEALTKRLADAGHDVVLLREGGSRRRWGKRVAVRALGDAEEVLEEVERVVLATPIGAVRETLEGLAPHLQGNHRMLTLARGLTPELHLRASESALRFTACKQLAVLAGAADPRALGRKQPVARVVGSANPTWAAEVQAARVYTNEDPVGVELANALAAVLAVAMGAARALGAPAATLATALTRAIAEMDRLVRGLGGTPNTAYGLAGLGVLSTMVFEGTGEACHAGEALARGDLEAARGAVELVEAARTLRNRAQMQRLRAPMVDAVCALFEGELAAADAMAELMSRRTRAERG